VATADAAKALTVSAGSALDQIDFVVPPNTVQTGNVAAAYAVTQSFDHSRFVQIQGVVTKTPLPDGQYSAPPVLIPLIAHINVKDVSGAITDWAVFSGNGTSCPLRLGDQIEFSGFQAKNGGPQVFVEREIRIK
jgi:hypothetical protein